MDMTHDEAYSYRLVKTDYFIALFGSANTHWLNSFFLEVLNRLFGDAPGWLRLHSVLAFPFFALAIYHLGQLINGIPGRLLFYALVLLNPYVLDFFSLARGYGLAMTFQAWSLVYFVKAARSGFQYRSWLMVFIMNALAIASNLSYFYTVAGMAGFLGVTWLAGKVAGQPIGKAGTRLLLLYLLLLLGTIADLLFIKYYGKDLGYGGNSDLIGSLFGSVWEGSLYGASYGHLAAVLTYFSFYGAILAAAVYGVRFVRRKEIDPGFLFSIPLLSILVLNLIFHGFFTTPYLYGRTALQWYVPGLLLICLAGGEWLSLPGRFRAIGTGLAALVSLVILTHFMDRFNKRWCFEWSLQANSRQAVYDLYSRKPQHPAVGFSIGGVFNNYYHLLDSTLTPLPNNLPDQYAHASDTALRQCLLTSDYVITAYPVTLQCLEAMGLRYAVLKTYPPGNNLLVRIYH